MDNEKHSITIGGVPLEQYLKDKDEEESSESSKEEIRDKKKIIYHSDKCQYQETKKISPRGRKWAMSEINQEYMDENVKNNPSIIKKMLALFLAGGKWSSADMYKEINRISPNCLKGRMLRIQDIYGNFSRIKKSALFPLIDSEKIDNTTFYFIPEDKRNVSIDDLYKVYDRREKDFTLQTLYNEEFDNDDDEGAVQQLEPSGGANAVVQNIINSITSSLEKTDTKHQKVVLEIRVLFGVIKDG